MKVNAYAKINLFLDVVGIRDDGYHLLQMVMQQIDIYDEVTVNKSEKGIRLSTDSDKIPVDNKNLAFKAAEMFIKEYGIEQGVDIFIKKNIPVEAGLAGGSTDAAAVLKCMRDLFKPSLSNKQLENMAVRLGADVPYCLYGKTALCEGIGEKITMLKSFKDKILVLVKPDFGISTKDVYKAIDKKQINHNVSIKNMVEAIKNDDLISVCKSMVNNLELVTLEKAPSLINIKDTIRQFNACGVLMSGSGPTIFGLFDDMVSANKCYDFMKSKYNQVFLTKTI